MNLMSLATKQSISSDLHLPKRYNRFHFLPLRFHGHFWSRLKPWTYQHGVNSLPINEKAFLFATNFHWRGDWRAMFGQVDWFYWSGVNNSCLQQGMSRKLAKNGSTGFSSAWLMKGLSTEQVDLIMTIMVTPSLRVNFFALSVFQPPAGRKSFCDASYQKRKVKTFDCHLNMPLIDHLIKFLSTPHRNSR